jgi:hypothetical protein
MPDLNDVLYDMESDYKREREQLISAMQILAQRLQRAAQQLSDDAHNMPNACGEVQGSGTTIDQLCAVVCEKGRTLKLVKLLKK